MFGLTISELFVIILGLITIAQFIFKLVQGVRDPNVKQDTRVQRLEDGCLYKHKALDESLASINKSIYKIKDTFMLFQQNDFKHIEARMTDLEKGQVRIETMLDERLPRKQMM